MTRASRQGDAQAVGDTTADRTVPAFVGRASALTTLVSALERASLVLVEGEAGIGKTRLLREALASLNDRTVLAAACLPLSEPFPLGPRRRRRTKAPPAGW